MKNAKVETVKIEKEISADEKNLSELISKMNLPKKSQSNRSGMYKDTEHLKNFDGGKKWRSAKRKELINKFALPLMQSIEANNNEKSKENLQKFLTFYSETYTSNNFEVNSCLQKNDGNNFEFLSRFFKIVLLFCKVNKIEIKK